MSQKVHPAQQAPISLIKFWGFIRLPGAVALSFHKCGCQKTLPVFLRRAIRDLEKKLYLAEKTIEVKDLLSTYEAFRAGGAKKNKGRKQKAGKRRSAE